MVDRDRALRALSRLPRAGPAAGGRGVAPGLGVARRRVRRARAGRHRGDGPGHRPRRRRCGARPLHDLQRQGLPRVATAGRLRAPRVGDRRRGRGRDRDAGRGRRRQPPRAGRSAPCGARRPPDLRRRPVRHREPLSAEGLRARAHVRRRGARRGLRALHDRGDRPRGGHLHGPLRLAARGPERGARARRGRPRRMGEQLRRTA